MRRALILLALGGLLGGAFAFGFALSGREQAAAPRTESVVDAVRAELAARYYRPIPSRVLRLEDVRSMIAALGDPYTEYLNDAAYRLLQREIAGSYTGIGITLLPAPAGLLVIATQAGPGRNAGIRVGDTITRVGGTPAAQLGLAGALARITGPIGSRVNLRIERAGAAITRSIRREEVQDPAVVTRLVTVAGRTYGYIRITVFRRGVAADVAAALRRVRQTVVDGVVLDLRENPGGLFDEALNVSSLFLSRGVVVSLQGAHQPREVYRASGHPVLPRLPLAVLVNGYTASSAEIVAAALHEDRRATLVGEHTFGKAVVQSIDPLQDGGALALTTGRYFTPTGADISRKGLRPDVRAVDDPRTPTDDVLTAALSSLAAAQS
ncbi:MAG: S41 family peptidase [Gaiellaceae bacterium]